MPEVPRASCVVPQEKCTSPWILTSVPNAASVSGVRPPLIFVVEDDADIARLIAHNLRASGFEVQTFLSGASVISEALREMPVLFLLDVMLPGTDGFELCRHIRQTPALSAAPIIFLTAKTGEADRVKGLELGGDDYITKPFSPRELVARIRSVLRGLSQNSVGCAKCCDLGDLEIDVCSMTVQVQGRNVLTTVREFRLLEYLANASRPRPDARSIARRGLEGNSLRHAAIHRRLHPPPSRKNRTRSPPSAIPEDPARYRLPIRSAKIKAVRHLTPLSILQRSSGELSAEHCRRYAYVSNWRRPIESTHSLFSSHASAASFILSYILQWPRTNPSRSGKPTTSRHAWPNSRRVRTNPRKIIRCGAMFARWARSSVKCWSSSPVKTCSNRWKSCGDC